jgi:hypothetical protein
VGLLLMSLLLLRNHLNVHLFLSDLNHTDSVDRPALACSVSCTSCKKVVSRGRRTELEPKRCARCASSSCA